MARGLCHRQVLCPEAASSILVCMYVRTGFMQCRSVMRIVVHVLVWCVVMWLWTHLHGKHIMNEELPC